MRRRTSSLIILVMLILTLTTQIVLADDWYEDKEGYFTLKDESGKELTIMAREIYIGDEYISEDNKHYSVERVDKKNKVAYAKYRGDIELPILGLAKDSVEVLQREKGNILLYCTHSDESYVPTDGKSSIKGKGGIYDVAEALKSNLEKKGAKVVLDKAAHDPHDAGAYRRSRQTAVKLIKENTPVTAVFDLHRDAVPKKAYTANVDGQQMSKIRIVIGRRNQNRQANEELAKKIKGVADKNYPGLIKDIFIGRGMYNQELSPRSLLFEMGTYENTKEEVQKSTAYLADVITKCLYGGSVQPKDKSGGSRGPRQKVTPISQEKTTGGRSGIIWLVVFAVVGGIAFLVISTGGKELSSKVSNFKQEFSSFLGRKNKKDE